MDKERGVVGYHLKEPNTAARTIYVPGSMGQTLIAAVNDTITSPVSDDQMTPGNASTNFTQTHEKH